MLYFFFLIFKTDQQYDNTASNNSGNEQNETKNMITINKSITKIKQ